MSHADSIRDEILCLIRDGAVPGFLIAPESGDRVLIEHPENISFDREGRGEGSDEFYVITGRVRLFSTFSAVSSVTEADRGGPRR
jgi:hypothetical protein